MRRIFHSIRFTVPLVLLIAGGALLVASYFGALDRVDREGLKLREESLRAFAIASARMIAGFEARGDRTATHEMVEWMAGRLEMRSVLLVDGSDRVVDASPGSWNGRTLAPGDDLADLELIRRARASGRLERRALANGHFHVAVPLAAARPGVVLPAGGADVFFVDSSSHLLSVAMHEATTAFFVLIALLGVVVLAIAVFALHRGVSAPAMRLADAAERFAAGERGARTGLRGRDELHRAAEAFDRLADRLEAAESDRMQQRRLLDALLERLPVGVVAVDGRDQRVLFMNDYFRKISGFEIAPDVRHPDVLSRLRFHRPDGSPLPREDLAIPSVLRTGETREFFPLVLERPDGERIPLLAGAAPVRFGNTGAPDAVVGVIQDRRDLEQVFSDLRRSERMLEALLDSASVGVVMVSREDRRILYVNRRFSEIAGTPFAIGDVLREGAVNMSVHVEDGTTYPTDRRSIATVVRTGRPASLLDAFIRRPDGTTVPVHVTSTPVNISGGRDFDAVVAVVQDRGEMEETIQELRQWERRYRGVAKITGQAIYEWDAVADRCHFSGNLGPVFGYTNEEINSNAKWNAITHPDDLPAVEAEMAACQRERRAFDATYRVRHADGRWLWVRDRGELIVDADGRFLRMVGALDDVTRQQETEAQLRHAQKMETVGTLAGGIAHDFNNQLTGVLGHLDLLAEELDPADPRHENVRVARGAALRCAELTRGLLAFSRMLRCEPRPTAIPTAIEEAAALLRRMLPSTIRIEVASSAPLPPAMVDPTQLQQVLFNLCVNARDAMPDGGRIRFAARTREITAEQARDGGRSEGRYVEIEIADDGAGIAPEVLPRIFEPFFTTKPVGHGTGLGLSMVYGIVSQHRGWVDVESTPGAGATFRIALPAAEGATAATAPAPRPGREPLSPATTVLVVDDEPVVRRLARRTLEAGGHRVIEAENGDEALARVDAQADDIALVLLDLTMPGTPVRKILPQLLERHPSLKVVLSSGFSDVVSGGGEFAALPFLAKPYAPRELVEIVRATLEARVVG